jgi:hypothetical protein
MFSQQGIALLTIPMAVSETLILLMTLRFPKKLLLVQSMRTEKNLHTQVPEVEFG